MCDPKSKLMPSMGFTSRYHQVEKLVDNKTVEAEVLKPLSLCPSRQTCIAPHNPTCFWETLDPRNDLGLISKGLTKKMTLAKRVWTKISFHFQGFGGLYQSSELLYNFCFGFFGLIWSQTYPCPRLTSGFAFRVQGNLSGVLGIEIEKITC